MSNVPPLAWGWRFSARTSMRSFSPTFTGRWSVMVLVTCTRPASENGKASSAISAACIGKVCTCSQVAGTSSRNVKPVTRQYSASRATSCSWLVIR